MQILQDLPWLYNWKGGLEHRQNCFNGARQRIEREFGSLTDFADAYKTYGVHKVEGGISYKEWAPNARELYLLGDFNNWEKDGKVYPAERSELGTFSLFIPDLPDGRPAIPHGSKVKCRLVCYDGRWLYRIPACLTTASKTKTPKSSTDASGIHLFLTSSSLQNRNPLTKPFSSTKLTSEWQVLNLGSTLTKSLKPTFFQ